MVKPCGKNHRHSLSIAWCRPLRKSLISNSVVFLVSDMSIPEDIDEQSSMSSRFHSGSAKVRY